MRHGKWVPLLPFSRCSGVSHSDDTIPLSFNFKTSDRSPESDAADQTGEEYNSDSEEYNCRVGTVTISKSTWDYVQTRIKYLEAAVELLESSKKRKPEDDLKGSFYAKKGKQ